MRPKPISALLRSTFLLVAIAASGEGAWAATGDCAYATSGALSGGTGMGGTGDIAKGTGMGGTGIRMGVYINESPFAGNVTISQGTVEAQRNGRSRFLAKGDPVCAGDTIITSQTSSLQIRMTDGGMITVRPQTQLRIEKFIYGGTDKDSSLITLLNGACHIISGEIGKRLPRNDLLKTPTATIGARGADHEATVIRPKDGGSYHSGSYDKVNNGTTFISTEKGEINIQPNQAGYAADIGEKPVLLKDIPGFYNTNRN